MKTKFEIKHGKKFRLSDIDPKETQGMQSKEHAEDLLQRGAAQLSEYQDKLYAQEHWAVLLIFQGMDAAGKDGVISHVMSGVNPQGCRVYSFKAPSIEELNHDFLWRTNRYLPERGRIGIFNRSYYEETLVVRVHPDELAKEKIPPGLVTRRLWHERFQDINSYESYLHRNGIIVRKFFLHLSEQEQKKRLLARIDDPNKNWKFSAADIKERHYWKDYMKAYEDMIRHTSTPHAPWYVVPADNKWFSRVVVADVIVETLKQLNLKYPKVDAEQKKILEVARRQLRS